MQYWNSNITVYPLRKLLIDNKGAGCTSLQQSMSVLPPLKRGLFSGESVCSSVCLSVYALD